MNRMILIFSMVISMEKVTGQTLNEWLRQKQTQKKYLVQQVAALKLYLDYLKKGYAIVDKGLTMVGDIKHENFDIDLQYIGSLKEASNAVRGSAKVSAIMLYHQMVLAEFSKLNGFVMESELFATDEKRCVAKVYSNVLHDLQFSLADLEGVLSSSDFTMTDEERIMQVERIYVRIRETYVFTKCFANSARLLFAQRRKGTSEIRTMEKLNF